MIEQLGPLLRQKRGNRGLREIAAELGVSAATLSRVECGKSPDLKTFGALCRWLDVSPAEVLGLRVAALPPALERPKRVYGPETARRLGELIMAIQRGDYG